MLILCAVAVFHCELFTVGDTMDVLDCVMAGDRKSSVELDFYPSLALLGFRQVQFQLAIPALLYRILPKAKAQNAKLLEPGRGFRAWMHRCGRKIPEEILERIEGGIQDEVMVKYAGVRKHQWTRTEFPPSSNDCKYYRCRGCDLRLRGAFFAKTQLATDPENPECWGCKLIEELDYDERNQPCIQDQLHALDDGWLLRSPPPSPPSPDDDDATLSASFSPDRPIDEIVALAKLSDNGWTKQQHYHDANTHPNDDTRRVVLDPDDITFAEFHRRREAEQELERLRKKGRVLGTSNKVLGRHNWAKVRKQQY